MMMIPAMNSSNSLTMRECGWTIKRRRRKTGNDRRRNLSELRKRNRKNWKNRRKRKRERERIEQKEKEAADRAERLERQKLEQTRAKEEADRAEREKERAFELEKIRLEKEAEVQRVQSEHDLKLAQMQYVNGELETEPDENGGQGDIRRVRSRPVAMKALKLPPFNEDKDDLDAYWTRFERACAAFEVKQEHWSTQLARLLQGKSLEVYQRLSDADVGKYDVLKAQLLKRFRLTEGGYRTKFKLSKLEVGETPDQFVDRLKRYLDKWQGIKITTTISGIWSYVISTS